VAWIEHSPIDILIFHAYFDALLEIADDKVVRLVPRRLHLIVLHRGAPRLLRPYVNLEMLSVSARSRACLEQLAFANVSGAERVILLNNFFAAPLASSAKPDASSTVILATPRGYWKASKYELFGSSLIRYLQTKGLVRVSRRFGISSRSTCLVR